jgi:alkane 1-monooxygenase
MAYSLPITVAISFMSTGWLCFLPLLYGFGVIPLVDQLIGPRVGNLTAEEHDSEAKYSLYDFVIYLALPVQLFMLVWFLMEVQEPLTTSDLVGRITAMGMICGVLGINVAHELGHRLLNVSWRNCYWLLRCICTSISSITKGIIVM